MDKTKKIQHFILTRFNLYLWNKDKEGCPVRTKQWLEHRFELFNRYCLPSIKNQTSQNFEWIVLFDSTTPDTFREKITEWQKSCPQFVPVYVEPRNGRYFAEIFRKEVIRRFKGSSTSEAEEPSASASASSASVQEFKGRLLTTYLDNDDALNVRFVEDIQQRMQSLVDGSFIYYTEGYQYFTDHRYLMKIHYPRNHFVSVIESGNPSAVKTIYGYGSHYYIDKIKDVRIEYVKDAPMWCQVVHEKNMGNDAYFLNAKMVRENDNENENTLVRDFGLQVEVNSGIGLYLFRFLPRYAKTFIRRSKIKLRGYRFEK